MRVWVHFVFSLIIAIILYPLFGWKALFVLAGGVLIDVDHYIWYAYRHRKMNFFEAYKYYLKNLEKNDFTADIGILLVFHTIEFLAVMIILSFYDASFLLFTIGLLFHYLLDAVFLYFVAKQVIADHSIMHWILKNKFKKFK